MRTVHRNHHRKARELEELYRLPCNPPESSQPAPHVRRSLLPTLLVSLCCTLFGAACFGVNLAVPSPDIPAFSSQTPGFLPGVVGMSDAFERFDVHTPQGAAEVHRVMQAGHVNADRSTITGVVDSNSMTAALYWTFVLKNNNRTDKEASILVDLPKNSAISRATLWINGVPQEAAFASNQQVKEAYDWIVVRHRDPLLVTQVAPNRIKILAAPVTANGGTMKIRLGITVPFENERDGRNSVSMPHIVESNLKFDCQQDVHLTSTTPIQSFGSLRGSGLQVRANVPVDALSTAKIFVAEPNSSVFATRLTHTSPSQYVVASNNGTSLSLQRVDEKPTCEIIATEDAAARLSSLWAHQEIERLVQRGNVTDACELANRYRIVSSVSGAVVLETDADYGITAMNRDMYRTQGSSTPSTAPMLQGATGMGPMQAPQLQGATNGTVGPQGMDATVISGVNTAGTVRVNNLANLEALMQIVTKLGSLLGFTIAVNLVVGLLLKNGLGPSGWSKRKTVLIAASFAVVAVSLPQMMEALVGFARDINLFS